MADDGVPHGLKGYRSPWECRCDVCKAGWAGYIRERRAARKAEGPDELERRRKRSATRRMGKPKARTESGDSVVVGGRRIGIGEMERAVIEEAAQIPDAKATQIVAAKNLARLIDRLSNQEKATGASVVNSATKQLMGVMAEMRGDATKSKATGRRKSGGRLATVGALTKVRRAQ